MDLDVSDFNDAGRYFAGPGRSEWESLWEGLTGLVPQLQPSGQSGMSGRPVFDPKATNLKLTGAVAGLGWTTVPVPDDLTAFGREWDGGRGAVLAEWQFSNYPFLWNNIIRTEAVHKSPRTLTAVRSVSALVVVTKSGSWPSSNSTLYYEQARAQIEIVTRLRVFDVPIRLVGLMLPTGISNLTADWNTYPGSYGREPEGTERRDFRVRWGRAAMHGNRSAVLELR